LGCLFMGKTKVAWFLWKEYILPDAYEWEVQELIGVVLHIRGLEVVVEKVDKILKGNKAGVEKFVVNIVATDGDVTERLEIMYYRGEVSVWRIEEEEEEE